MARAKEAAKEKSEAKKGDTLTMFILVMGFLCLVMGVLYFVIASVRDKYREANQKLVKIMAFEGKDRDPEEAPRTIPDLAWEVESLSHTFQEASGGGGLDRSISTQMMEMVATKAGLKSPYSTRERQTKGPGGNYETITMKYEYTGFGGRPPEIWRLLTLLWNIESRGRYRVSEVEWQVAEPNDNPMPPFDKIKKPRIEVALRVPILEE